MTWQIPEPPVSANSNSYNFKDWFFQVWKILKFDSNVVSTSTNYEAKMSDGKILVNASGGARTVTLPVAQGNLGKTLIIKKTDATGNSVSIVPRGAETIDSAASQSTTSRAVPLRVFSDNLNWHLW